MRRGPLYTYFGHHCYLSCKTEIKISDKTNTRWKFHRVTLGGFWVVHMITSVMWLTKVLVETRFGKRNSNRSCNTNLANVYIAGFYHHKFSRPREIESI